MEILIIAYILFIEILTVIYFVNDKELKEDGLNTIGNLLFFMLLTPFTLPFFTICKITKIKIQKRS